MMDSSKPRTFFLRSTSSVSLNERFSRVLVDQLTQSRMVTFDPILLQQRKVSGPQPVVLLVKKEPSPLRVLQDTVSELVPGASPRVKQRLRRRRNVWTRLGWKRFTHRISAPKPRGYWSFRNKYRWRSRFTSTYRRHHLQSRLGRCCLLTGTNVQNPAAGQLRQHLRRGRFGASNRQSRSRRDIPTRKQLDAQLDEYMSLSKSRLDQQLDDYMSMSRQRLDAELDEYMSMAGETELSWD